MRTAYPDALRALRVMRLALDQAGAFELPDDPLSLLEFVRDHLAPRMSLDLEPSLVAAIVDDIAAEVELEAQDLEGHDGSARLEASTRMLPPDDAGAGGAAAVVVPHQTLPSFGKVLPPPDLALELETFGDDLTAGEGEPQGVVSAGAGEGIEGGGREEELPDAAPELEVVGAATDLEALDLVGGESDGWSDGADAADPRGRFDRPTPLLPEPVPGGRRKPVERPIVALVDPQQFRRAALARSLVQGRCEVRVLDPVEVEAALEPGPSAETLHAVVTELDGLDAEPMLRAIALRDPYLPVIAWTSSPHATAEHVLRAAGLLRYEIVAKATRGAEIAEMVRKLAVA